MVDIDALMQALPVSGLEPQTVAYLDDFFKADSGYSSSNTIRLLEPPAKWHEPCIQPKCALHTLLRSLGYTLEEAQAKAEEMVSSMKDEVSNERWAIFYDPDEPNESEYLQVSDFLHFLRHARKPAYRLPEHILVFMDKSLEVVKQKPIFPNPDWDERRTLGALPPIPSPKAMMQYVYAPPWCNILSEYCDASHPFMVWRESMRPVAEELEDRLGEPVFHFALFGFDITEDIMHRFLVLHWCCTYMPQSAFVRHLLESSRAENVEELKAALIAPANYGRCSD